jgi:hypothetical protein
MCNLVHPTEKTAKFGERDAYCSIERWTRRYCSQKGSLDD